MKDKIIEIFENWFGVTIRDKNNIHYIDQSITDFASEIESLIKENYYPKEFVEYIFQVNKKNACDELYNEWLTNIKYK